MLESLLGGEEMRSRLEILNLGDNFYLRSDPHGWEKLEVGNQTLNQKRNTPHILALPFMKLPLHHWEKETLKHFLVQALPTFVLILGGGRFT